MAKKQYKYLKGAEGASVEDRIKMYRFVEKMVMESADTISDIHGGGSPEAHRVTILRECDLENRTQAAKRLAGIDSWMKGFLSESEKGGYS